jgi:hypothetical protein
LIPDPFRGTSAQGLPWIENRDWWYRRRAEVMDQEGDAAKARVAVATDVFARAIRLGLYGARGKDSNSTRSLASGGRFGSTCGAPRGATSRLRP